LPIGNLLDYEGNMFSQQHLSNFFQDTNRAPVMLWADRPGDPTEDLVLYLGEKTDQIMLLVLGTRVVFPWLREDAYLLLGDPTLV
jgi:hypothetical protein